MSTVRRMDKEDERMACVEGWYKDNLILPPLTVKPTVLEGFSDNHFHHSHWVQGSSKMLSLREHAQHALLNAFQLGKPQNNDMVTAENEWYGKADLRDLVKMFESCQKYSLIIHNIRSCYHVSFLRARQIDDRKWLYCAVNTIRAVMNFTSYVSTRIAYASLFGVSLCKGFECVKNFRFDLVLAFSVEDYFSYVEKRTAIRELLVALDKNRRDKEESTKTMRMLMI